MTTIIDKFENAVLKAIDLYHRIHTLPFASERSELFDGPSVSLGEGLPPSTASVGRPPGLALHQSRSVGQRVGHDLPHVGKVPTRQCLLLTA